jgi:uncharacterized protein (DUF362 family)
MPHTIDGLTGKPVSRRRFLELSAGLAGTALLAPRLGGAAKARSRVAVVRAPRYSLEIKNILAPYFRPFGLNLRGKSVLLKPNIVDFHDHEHHIFTDPTVLAAAIELFGDLGAKVRVGEASGLRRDTNTILHYSGYKEMLGKYSVEFIDLNLDEVERVPIPSNLTGLDYLFVPRTVLRSDFIVSMPKMKTHHWAGVTLSLKNMFGVLPGIKYGWPKNRLHTIGLHEAIVDVGSAVRPGFAIIDGIYGIEGNGPLFGDNKFAGVIVMSDDFLAADAVASRIMGINPEKVEYLRLASRPPRGTVPPLGNTRDIEVLGEPIAAVRQDFKLLDEFKRLRL